MGMEVYSGAPRGAAPRHEAALFALGLAIPFLILSLVHVYHAEDVRVFVDWASCWRTDARRVYSLCPSANYPWVGVAVSGGAIAALQHALSLGDVEEIARYYRLILAGFDAADFALLVLIGRALRLRHAVALALVIEVLPSTWAGGAVWGQIDTISQFFLLVSLHGLMRAYQLAGAPQPRRAAHGFFLLGLSALALCALTKQLAIFSIVATAPLILAALWRFAGARRGLWLGFGCMALAGGLFLFLDRQAEAPGYFGSSFLYVWLGGGSHHGRIIAGNGFNIWVFLGRDMASSSDDPFWTPTLFGRAFGLTPRIAGFALYGLAVLALAAPLLRFARGAFSKTAGRGDARFLAGCLLAVAMMNLGFNVFLTGTHERYLYHFYSFALLALAGLAPRAVRAPLIGLLLASGTLYGLFVLSVIRDLPGVLAAWIRPEPLAGLHALLLLTLSALILRLGAARGPSGSAY